jgi:hypothetical protein
VDEALATYHVQVSAQMQNLHLDVIQNKLMLVSFAESDLLGKFLFTLLKFLLFCLCVFIAGGSVSYAARCDAISRRAECGKQRT